MSKAPPFPEMTRRDDGAIDQTWNVAFRSRLHGPFDRAALQIAERAVDMYKAQLSADGHSDLPGLALALQVSLEPQGSTSLDVQIVSSGGAPNWNSAGAVTWVMVALEETYGRIMQVNGTDRAKWNLWPLPREHLARADE